MSLLIALALQASTAPARDDANTVVVVASLSALRAAYEQCRKGGCSPRQDIIASIRYAEVMFRGGDYLNARYLLQDTIKRQKGAADIEPIAVAALYEATVTVARHDGEQNVASHAANARVRVLRDHLPEDSPALLRAELDLGDLKIRAGQFEEADTDFKSLARRGEAANQPDIVAAAIMRRAIVARALHRRQAAQSLLEGIVESDSQTQVTKLVARALQARFAREDGDMKATNALVDDFVRAAPSVPPVLIWQPELASPTHMSEPIVRMPGKVTFASGFSWADIGFMIKSDGYVDSPEVLRGRGGTGWTGPILEMIGKRQYSPAPGAATGIYRIERWTLTSNYITPTGSLIRGRYGDSHYEQIDLTNGEPTNIGK